MGKRKKVKRGKKDNIEKCPQPVMEIDTLPSPTSPNGEAGTNSDPVEILCPKSDYNITFTTRGENVIGTIYWKVGKFYDLDDGKPYVCSLPCEKTNCCNVWQLAVKKCKAFICMGLLCYINDRNVTFSVLLGSKIYKTSHLLKVEATEQLCGKYAGEVQFSTLEHYKDELRKEFFTLKCEVMLYVNDLTRSDYSQSMCTCDSFNTKLDELHKKKYFYDFADITLKVGNNYFPFHACILAAHSPTFCDFFLRNRESCEKTTSSQHRFLIPLFERPVITGDTLEQLFWHIYSGTTLPLSVDTAISLFYLSTALGMRNVRKRCRQFLKMKLSKENFLKIYSLAVLQNSLSLKIAAEAFVLKNTDLIESLISDNGRNSNAPSFVTAEELENIKTSLKELFEKVQNRHSQSIHNAQ